ncbi:hypothetical protein BKA70DRAFT_1573368 [Coprinopsis sp. MPI-PUGE-AT-0042]|nr:hypothetical protein BKA70DRAFT_1573368 [Coprinopsis sp. MPI-PUGE-AT-0042]
MATRSTRSTTLRKAVAEATCKAFNDAGDQASAEGTTLKKPKRAARKPKIDPNSLDGVDEDVDDTAGFLPRPVQGNEKGGWKIGAHVSAAGGVENAPVNAAKIGTEGSTQLKFDPKTDLLVHGNYLVNPGNPDASKRKVAYEYFLDEIRQCGQ